MKNRKTEKTEETERSISSTQSSMAEPTHSSSTFDSLPDSLILHIFNSVSDVKTLIRCRAVSKRFNSLVPDSDSLSLTVDCVISSDPDHNHSFLFGFFKSVVKSFFDLISPVLLHSESHNSPARILRPFRRIQRLQIEFPVADPKVERFGEVKWRAEFGETLRSCVILIFREIRVLDLDDVVDSDFDMDLIGGRKSKVFLTISALITAAARHHVAAEVAEEHLEMGCLVLRDRGGEGAVVMEKDGLDEWRKSRERGGDDGGGVAVAEGGEWRPRRTRVPSTTVRMRHLPRMELRGGIWMEGATLVVVRPSGDASKDETADVEKEDGDVALRAFDVDDVYREAVGTLLKKGRRYQLELNSF